MTLEQISEFIKRDNLGEVLKDVPLKGLCSIKVGGTAKMIYIPNNSESLVTVLKTLESNKLKYKVIGRGSNIILPNKNLSTILIKINGVLDFIEITKSGIVNVGAGFSFQKLARICSKKGMSGLEFAGGIPGTVGGAIYMNAGAHLLEVKDLIEEVTIIDESKNIKVLTKKECKFSYRHSIFHEKNYIILSAKLKLKHKDEAKVFKKMLGNLEYRKELQPLDKPTFGSVFKNPDKYHAGKLIEDCGLKGYKIGGAQVSQKHANFIENIGDATAKDVINLIEYIKETVKSNNKVELITEVEIFDEE